MRVSEGGLEPPRPYRALGPQPSASTNSATPTEQPAEYTRQPQKGQRPTWTPCPRGSPLFACKLEREEPASGGPMIQESVIKDPALAPEGHRKIEWVAQHSPVLNTISEDRLADGALRGRKVAMTIHLEAKTAYLALLLSKAGAEVTVAGSNPLSTQDDVCAALAERGVRVFATHDPSDEDFEGYLHKTLETGPDLIVDDGAELVGRLIEHHPDLVGNVQ